MAIILFFLTEFYLLSTVPSFSLPEKAGPSPTRETVLPPSIAVMINRHPLPWGDNRVDFVFLLSLRGEDRPLFQDIFTALSSFLSSEQNCQLLKSCTHFDAFLNLLIQSSRGGS